MSRGDLLRLAVSNELSREDKLKSVMDDLIKRGYNDVELYIKCYNHYLTIIDIFDDISKGLDNNTLESSIDMIGVIKNDIPTPTTLVSTLNGLYGSNFYLMELYDICNTIDIMSNKIIGLLKDYMSIKSILKGVDSIKND